MELFFCYKNVVITEDNFVSFLLNTPTLLSCVLLLNIFTNSQKVPGFFILTKVHIVKVWLLSLFVN